MDNEIESRISQIERRLARTQMLAGILFLVALIDHFTALKKMFGDLVLPLLFLLGLLALIMFGIFCVEQLFTKKN